MTDKIIIKGLNLYLTLGITEREQQHKQVVILDTELLTNIKPSAKTDNIDQTINYATVVKEIRALIEKPYKTIECLAETIAGHIKKNFPVQGINLTLKKIGSLPRKGGQYAAIQISR